MLVHRNGIGGMRTWRKHSALANSYTSLTFTKTLVPLSQKSLSHIVNAGGCASFNSTTRKSTPGDDKGMLVAFAPFPSGGLMGRTWTPRHLHSRRPLNSLRISALIFWTPCNWFEASPIEQAWLPPPEDSRVANNLQPSTLPSLIVTTYLTVNRGIKAPLSLSTFT